MTLNDLGIEEEETSFDNLTSTLYLPRKVFEEEEKEGNRIAIVFLKNIRVRVSADLSKRPTVIIKLLRMA